MKTFVFAMIGALALSSVSCMTTYDAYGRPRQSVDPAAATVGIAAAGLIGYAAGKDRRDRRYYDRRHSHYRHGGYYPRRTYYRYR